MKSCALYTVLNTLTGEVYVGITIAPRRRWTQHQEAKTHSPLHVAIQQFGKENFRFNIECWYASVEEAGVEERKRIELLRASQSSHYNVSLGGGRHSDETRAKIGQANKVALKGNKLSQVTKDKISKKVTLALTGRKRTPETCARMSKARTGTKHSPEALVNIRAAALLRCGVPLSTETKEKLRAKKLGQKHSAEAKLKISQSKLGKPLSPEHKKTKREACQTAEHRAKLSRVHTGMPNNWQGRSHSPESIAKMSSLHKDRHRNLRLKKAILKWEMTNDPGTTFDFSAGLA